MQFSTITEQIPFIGRKKHQREVFWNLAQNHTRFLYNVAFKYAGNQYDAEDLVQETLYTAYDKFHQLRDSRKFKSWIFAILRNHFLKSQRKKTPVQTDEFEEGIDYLSQLESVSLQQDVASSMREKQRLKRSGRFWISCLKSIKPYSYYTTWKTALIKKSLRCLRCRSERLCRACRAPSR